VACVQSIATDDVEVESGPPSGGTVPSIGGTTISRRRSGPRAMGGSSKSFPARQEVRVGPTGTLVGRDVTQRPG
jgi:hypothetical protein